jgi:predicted phage baseplate assembly protein
VSEESNPGCCGASVDFTARANPPGQSAISYRLGTHGQFLARMIARIPTQEVEGARPLAALTTRRSDDPSIALLDAWACTADVLCFYQERIVNEGYLRTATERRSVLELARAIGYELGPGVAAAAYLAFTIDDTVGAATISPGVQIQSVPGQDEKPQLFETVEEIEARAEWNAIRPRLLEDFPPDGASDELWVEGVSTGLVVGAPLLVTGWHVPPDFHYLTAVEPDPDRGVTRLAWDPESFEIGLVKREDAVIIPRSVSAMAADEPSAAGSGDVQAYTFRIQTWVHSVIVPAEATPMPPAGYDNATVQLDGYYAGIGKGSWLVVATEDVTIPVEVSKAVPSFYESGSGADTFKVRSLTVTVLVEEGAELDCVDEEAQTCPMDPFQNWQEGLIHAQNVEVALTGAPLTSAVEGSEIELDGVYAELSSGRRIALSGRPADSDEDADAIGEIAVIGQVLSDEERTTLVLEAALANRYDRVSLRINANVVRATHGETVPSEVIGSGDATQAHQVMALRQTPLTFVPAATASGGESTLAVKVDGLPWSEVGSLYQQAADARVYAMRSEDDGTSKVYFGDGSSGARLPSGTENVTVSYRKGLGSAGNVAAGRLTQLKTKPLGVRTSTNVAAASGGVDAEALDAARSNAPLAIRTLDRLVSLRDYEDFARAFSGIAKAAAVAAWDGGRKVVHVTIAGEDGAEIDATSETYVTLVAAIAAAADRGARSIIASYRKIEVALAAGVIVDAGYDGATVLANVQAELADALGFASRDLAEPLSSAEVIAAIQGVDGVVAVDLDALYRIDADDTEPSLASVLVASPARWDGSVLQAAELLVLAAGGATLVEMSA